MLGLGKSAITPLDALGRKPAKTRAGSGAPDSGVLDHVVAAEKLCFALADKAGHIVQVGGDFETITGRTPDETIIGRRLSDLVSELRLQSADGSGLLDGPTVLETIAELRGSGETKRLHALTQTEDGRTVAVSTFLPGDGRVLACLRDVSDVTEDRAMLRVALHAANAGCWALDLGTGKFSYSETVLSRLSDREQALIERNGLFAIVDPEDLTRISSQWQDILSGVAPFDLTYRVKTEADGLMWQRSIGQLQRRPDGHVTRAIAFVMDISEDMKNRAELQEAQGLARAKESFMARMSHEIRTPLNAIIGMVDSLSDEPMPATVRDVIADIEDASENLNELLTRTLDHAKLEDGQVRAEFEPTDPRTVLRACDAMWRAKASGKGLDFRLSIAPDVPETVPLDTFRLRQCLNNLIGNALKFTSQGAVTLAAKTVTRGGVPHIAFIVQDTGIGIAPSDQAAVFDAYSQADGTIGREFGGTGLGLSICRQLCALMAGEIVLRSAPGKGSAFLVFLPLDPKAALQSAQDAADAARRLVERDRAVPARLIEKPSAADRSGTPTLIAPVVSNAVGPDTQGRLPFEGLSVLCVEDNPINQKVVERLIGKRVSQLHFANHGREALSVLNTVHIDVVLMDVHMPVMDGIETTMEIRKSEEPYANVIIIALTADPDYQQMRICKNIGMNDTIAKPVRREDILEAFNRTLGTIGETHGVRVALR